jgi:hypothetical protein
LREVRIGTKVYLCSTQDIDGFWKHLRVHFWNRRTKRQYLYQEMRCFQLEWNARKNQQELYYHILVRTLLFSVSNWSISLYFFAKLKNIQSILFLKFFRMKKKKEFPNYSVISVTKKKTLNLTVFEKTGYFEACPKAS